MIADLFDIKETGRYGKGIFARKFIPKGTIVHFLCRKCGTWSKKELARLPKDKLDFVMEHEYPMKYCDERLLYINHSCNPNIMESGRGFDIVVKEIKEGEEATEDYRIFKEELHFADGCKCGEPNCMKRTTYTRPPPQKLQRFWDKKIEGALRLINSVNQPLKIQLVKEHPDLSHFFNKNGKQPKLLNTVRVP